MDRVLRRRLILAALAVVAGVVIGLTISQQRTARLTGRPPEKLQPVDIVIQAAGKPSPLGETYVVRHEHTLGRMLVAKPGGPAGVAVFEPAPGAELNQAMGKMMQWVDADPKLMTVYVLRPAAPKAVPKP